ncbi:hypothetical protein LO80_00805 [Candidatus Francisella endociliophora]|uniref:Host attachment protein n=1 Tax=Candidatus Francisella endociliophora TaxID=653937 RepID=A0A097EM62_9GAMM|nr:host attachment protein [Francisella sp. FSC1006]AIT08656.1 hypothetical protein LO80_00805 [Francisella sp. FSC1006]
MKKWLIIADSATAEIYCINNSNDSVDEFHPPVKLVDKLSHLESKLKDSELMTDKPGGHMSNRGSFNVYEPSTSPHEAEKKDFANILGNYLKIQSDKNEFDGLIICMEPGFTGKVIQNLTKDVERKIFKKIQKYLMNLPENEKMRFISDICKEVSSEII